MPMSSPQITRMFGFPVPLPLFALFSRFWLFAMDPSTSNSSDRREMLSRPSIGLWSQCYRLRVPPALHGVLETVLYVQDLATAEGFYVDILGFRKLSGEAERSLFLRAGESVFLLFRAEATERPGTLPPHGARGPGHTCFVVPASA